MATVAIELRPARARQWGGDMVRLSGPRPTCFSRLVLASTISIATAVTVAPGPAEALQVIPSGRPGAVTVYTPMISGHEQQVYGGPNLILTYRTFGTNGLALIKRSPRFKRQRQTVKVLYQLQWYRDNRWQNLLASPVYTRRLRPKSPGVKTPAWGAYPAQQATLATAYRFAYVIVWYNAKGRRIGTKVITHNKGNEAECATVHVPCTNYGTYLWM